jgi:hypothetical protein
VDCRNRTYAKNARLRYLLSPGPKSKLVASPKDWLGACSTPALLGDLMVRATYRSLDRARRIAQRSQRRSEAELAEDFAFTLTPSRPGRSRAASSPIGKFATAARPSR